MDLTPSGDCLEQQKLAQNKFFFLNLTACLHLDLKLKSKHLVMKPSAYRILLLTVKLTRSRWRLGEFKGRFSFRPS